MKPTTPIGGVLHAGVETISYDQRIIFTMYIRLILPADGFVFYVRSDLQSSSSTWQAAQAAVAALGLPASFTAKGSLHYGSEVSQDEAQTYAVNTIELTSQQELAPLNRVAPLVVYLSEVGGVRYAFSDRGKFYRQADIWHYGGDAIYPDVDSIVIDDAALIDTGDVVVSNSLPFWLGLLTYAIPALPIPNPGIVLYPSYVVPKNLPPPYGAVHIEPGSTVGISSAPSFRPGGFQHQLCSDEVTVTLFGLRNDQALQFIAWVGQYSLFTGNFGVMNIPVISDEKRGQTELNAIAQKKTVKFQVDYYQARAVAYGTNLIKSAEPSYRF
jgi:hypothetical protein